MNFSSITCLLGAKNYTEKNSIQNTNNSAFLDTSPVLNGSWKQNLVWTGA